MMWPARKLWLRNSRRRRSAVNITALAVGLCVLFKLFTTRLPYGAWSYRNRVEVFSSSSEDSNPCRRCECRRGGVVCRDDPRCNYHVDSGRPRQHQIGVAQSDKHQGDIHVMIPATGERLVGMTTLVNSVWKNTKSSVMFHLVTDKESYEHLQIWLDKSELRHIKREIIVFDDEWLRGKVTMRSTRADLATPVNFARFYLPRLFPDYNGRMIYLDDDIVVQGDIKELAETDIPLGTIAAFSDDCNNVTQKFGSYQGIYSNYLNFDNPNIQKLGLRRGGCVFNGGVFVADIGRWRQQHVTDQLECWMELNSKELIYQSGASQPPLLLVFPQRSMINPLWHIRHLGRLDGVRYSKRFLDEEARLLHWNGQSKPWDYPHQFGAHIWRKFYVPDPLRKHLPVR